MTTAKPKDTSATDKAPTAPVVPPENPAAYDPAKTWQAAPWGDTYYCEMCSTCMRFRYAGRIGGRVCVTSFNMNFPLVIIEGGRCNEYRPVPGAESLWTDDFVEEEEDYDGSRRRDEAPILDDEGARRREGPGGGAARRRPRRRPRRGAPGGGQGPA